MSMSKWWTFSDKLVDMDRDDSAVYELCDDSENVIYIGSTNEARRRLKEHLSEDAKTCIKRNAKKYRLEYRSDYVGEERRRYDAFIQANGRAPTCNAARP